MSNIKITKGPIRTMSTNELLSLGERALNAVKPTSYAQSEYGKSVAETHLVFHDAVKSSKSKSSYSLAEEDNATDAAYVGLSTISECNSKCPQSDVAEAAQKVYAVVSRFKNPTRKSYDEAYPVIKMILEGLDELDPNTIDKAGVYWWHKALRSQYDAFIARSSEINAQKTARGTRVVSNARDAFVSSYLKFIDFLNSKLQFESNEEVEKLAAALNEIIAQFISKSKAAATRAANGSESISEEDPNSSDDGSASDSSEG